MMNRPKLTTSVTFFLQVIFVSTYFFIISACNAQKKGEENNIIDKRGIVLYPSDLVSLGAEKWVDMMTQSGLNVLGIHTNTYSETLPKLKEYLESDQGKLLLKMCEEKNIAIEYELHILQYVLPRDLFHEHPEYFRMDNEGNRQQKFNMCFTEEGAYKEIEKNILEIVGWLKPTTHRYFFWTDDVKDAFCNCENCKKYTESEQSLIYENRILEILRKVDPKATVAHLAYHNTLTAPKKVLPLDGIFLEYAPINKDYDKPMAEEHIQILRNNLEIFPPETAHILEYWIDVSMFSKWERNNLKQVPWVKAQCERDVNHYTGLGIRSITSFGTWINAKYIEQYGNDHTYTMLSEYGEVLNSEIK